MGIKQSNPSSNKIYPRNFVPAAFDIIRSYMSDTQLENAGLDAMHVDADTLRALEQRDNASVIYCYYNGERLVFGHDYDPMTQMHSAERASNTDASNRLLALKWTGSEWEVETVQKFIYFDPCTMSTYYDRVEPTKGTGTPLK